ncbi:MAG: hypothetical protein IH840_06305, partial [Candidatus Heimdallarchaeota archaeon]|nr:hypothetical protein [Candidatus Heimdallarchaeota archaeon]
QLGFKYSYYPTQSNYYSLANAVFSQYPILDSGTIDLKPIVAWQRMAVWVLLDINGIATTRLYVTHLTNNGAEDYRVDQATQLMTEILKNDLSLENTILVGDFNMREFELIDDVKEPVEEYDIITADLKDAWLNTTNQLPNSDGFTSSAADPDKRIDYIFLSSQIIVEGCTVISTLVSDHLPLFCTITLP